MDINDKGMVLGSWVKDQGANVVVWIPRTDRTITAVPSGAFELTYENAINNHAQVALTVTVRHHTYQRAYLWDRKTRLLTDIGDLGGPYSNAQDINDRGRIVGGSHVRAARPYGLHAFLWRPNSHVMVDLGTLGGKRSFANAINDRGLIAGTSDTARGNSRAFLWHPKTKKMVNLGTLGPNTLSVEVGDINEKGQVVGTCRLGDGTTSRAFLWLPRSGQMINLGTLGGTTSYAFGINNLSQVVGYSTTASGRTRAFLWHPRSQEMVNLGKLAGTAGGTVAYAINDDGKIVGNSGSHPFLWTPKTHMMHDILHRLAG